MKQWLVGLLWVWCLGLSAHSFALEVYPFQNAQQEALYQELIHELRCVVCQNQSLAESNAPLAVDLRQRIHEKIMAGQSREQIMIFMVERYGEFVLYQPPLKWSTGLLWLAPLAFLGLGLLMLGRLIRGKRG